MVANKIFSLILLVFLFIACARETEKYVYLEIDNKELKNEIYGFIQKLDSTVECNYVIWVELMELNDSVIQYLVYPNTTFAFLDIDPFHFICSVDNRPVFFVINNLSKVGYESPYFKLKSEVIMDLIKQNFPEEYKEILKKKDDQLFLPNITNEYPETLRLIFTNGKLTEKKAGRGF
jgi:hypothetical protein